MWAVRSCKVAEREGIVSRSHEIDSGQLVARGTEQRAGSASLILEEVKGLRRAVATVANHRGVRNHTVAEEREGDASVCGDGNGVTGTLGDFEFVDYWNRAVHTIVYPEAWRTASSAGGSGRRGGSVQEGG